MQDFQFKVLSIAQMSRLRPLQGTVPSSQKTLSHETQAPVARETIVNFILHVLPMLRVPLGLQS